MATTLLTAVMHTTVSLIIIYGYAAVYWSLWTVPRLVALGWYRCTVLTYLATAMAVYALQQEAWTGLSMIWAVGTITTMNYLTSIMVARQRRSRPPINWVTPAAP